MITTKDLVQTVSGIEITKVCSISPDEDAKKAGISKNINVAVKFDGITLNDVFAKAMSSTVVTWQNGQGRKNFDKLTANQVIYVNFRAPASVQIDTEAAEIAKIAAMEDPTEREKYVRTLLAKANALIEPVTEETE